MYPKKFSYPVLQNVIVILMYLMPLVLSRLVIRSEKKMENKPPESVQEFIIRKEKLFKQNSLVRAKKLTRDGHNEWEREACTFMQQSSYPEKVFVIERLRRVKNSISISNSEKDEIEYRFGYYIVSKNGRTNRKWVWGQFCPLIPQEDLEPLLDKARKEGTLL